jgi:carboxylesterase
MTNPEKALAQSESAQTFETYRKLKEEGLKVGVLLAHGMTGAPLEMEHTAKYLEERLGCEVAVPLLPGHGGTPEDLLDITWHEWIDCLEQNRDKLLETCDIVFVGGLCMGAVASVQIAAHERVAGVIALSPVVRYDSKHSSDWRQIFLPLVDLIPILGRLCSWTEEEPYGLRNKRLVKMITERRKEAIARGETDPSKIYAYMVRQFQHLVAATKSLASNVICPVLIMHSKDDTIASVKTNPHIFKSWLKASSRTKFIELEGCDHVITLDLKRKEVERECADFICWVIAKTYRYPAL